MLYTDHNGFYRYMDSLADIIDLPFRPSLILILVADVEAEREIVFEFPWSCARQGALSMDEQSGEVQVLLSTRTND